MFFVLLTAYCVSRLAYRFYSHKMYVESNSIMGQFCGWLVKKAKCTDLPPEKVIKYPYSLNEGYSMK